MKNKMLTTEDTKVTENDNRQMIRSVKGRGRLAPGPRSASGRGGDFLILVQERPIQSNEILPRDFATIQRCRSGSSNARKVCVLARRSS